ncbi:MAG: DNA translocase FtsK 4TM domain-containing protein [Pseudomonadales bacterium]|nr:DNA translocase FtsK 4TM domain-containing protein [Pseudomonadales bacterium]
MSPTVIPVREIGLIGWLAAALFALLAIASYSPADPSFSFTGSGGEVSNLVGRSGAWFADLMFYLFGWPAWILPFAFTLAGIRLVMQRDEPIAWPLVAWRTAGWLAVLLAACVLLHMHFVSTGRLPAGVGGIFGSALAELGRPVLGWVGLTLLAVLVLMIGAQTCLGFSWLAVADATGRRLYWLVGLGLEALERRRSVRAARREALDTAEQLKEDRRERLSEERRRKAVRKTPDIQPPPPAAVKKPAHQKRLFNTRARGELPDLDLLDEPRSEDEGGYSEASLEKISQLLESKLREFGVEAEVVSVLPGPVVTRFELQPAPGVKVQKISSLAKDLARSLAVISVRIVEVIPNKPYVGIEIPNEDRAVVRLKEILASAAFQESKSPVTLALGKDIAGQPVVADVARMPHLLVAGTTGSGKSVGVNAMLLSLLYKSTPDEVRLILVDPKMLELSVYEGIPHLLTPVVTDMREAAQALNWCVAEMDRRYRLMAALGVRNLAGFNRQVQDAEKQGQPLVDPLWPKDSGLEAPPLARLPVIVVVIDEFADMMMIVGKKVETLIARIAQKARAAGIHLILATQRPSVDVITGLIKANIPTRMSFQVSSKVDSRTILDQGGAEQLLGHGDMLYLPTGTALPTRVHGAFVSDEEVHRVVSDWKERGEPDYLADILSGAGGEEPGFGFESNGGGAEQEDALYDEAVAFVIESRRPSISSVQRKLRIGYNRAARLIEAMEEAGVVSPMNSNGSREVLVPKRD